MHSHVPQGGSLSRALGPSYSEVIRSPFGACFEPLLLCWDGRAVPSRNPQGCGENEGRPESHVTGPGVTTKYPRIFRPHPLNKNQAKSGVNSTCPTLGCHHTFPPWYTLTPIFSSSSSHREPELPAPRWVRESQPGAPVDESQRQNPQ